MTGSQVLLETLKSLNIKNIFGYPGGAVLTIFDALYHDTDMEFILTRHEQGAAHAADAFGRVTGKPGVCIATSGPGGTNLVTGIMTAYMDSSPMIAITGQVPQSSRGLDNFQEVDIIGVTLPITKHSFTIERIEDIPSILKEAYHIATTGRPGPVVIDIPADVQLETLDPLLFENLVQKEVIPSPYRVTPIESELIPEISELINRAERPVIIAGAGVIKSRASGMMVRFAEDNSIPVVMSLLGLGAIPGDHILSLGMGGIHGKPGAHLALRETDLVIALGVRFENRFTEDKADFLRGVKIIHVDIDASELGKTMETEIAVHGDAGDILTKLLEVKKEIPERKAWVGRVEELKRFNEEESASAKNCLDPRSIFGILNKKTADDTILCTDVGQHQMWAAQYYNFSLPSQLITSGGAGTMGFGIPAALGVKAAIPGSQVISIVGDGGFQMTSQELTCLKEYNLPVTIIILNNSCLGMVKQLQDTHKNGRYMAVHLTTNPDFVALAKAHGINGIRVTTQEEFSRAVDKSITSSETTVIECIVDINESVYTSSS